MMFNSQSRNSKNKKNILKRDVSPAVPKRSSRKRRGNSRYVIFFLLIVLLLVVTIWGLNSVIKKMDLFNIKSIDISGNEHLEREFLRELASEFVGVNLFAIPVRTITYKYENIVRIEKIKIRRIIPGKLKIIVQERAGFLYVKTVEGVLIPLDKEKRILATPFTNYSNTSTTSDNSKKQGFYLTEDLPIVHTTIKLEDLVMGEILEDVFVDKVYDLHNHVLLSNINDKFISEYYQLKEEIFLIELHTGSHICLGKEDFSNRLHKLKFVMENLGIEPYTYLDLKFKDQVVIRSRGTK